MNLEGIQLVFDEPVQAFASSQAVMWLMTVAAAAEGLEEEQVGNILGNPSQEVDDNDQIHKGMDMMRIVVVDEVEVEGKQVVVVVVVVEWWVDNSWLNSIYLE